jgi:hypothetical protein
VHDELDDRANGQIEERWREKYYDKIDELNLAEAKLADQEERIAVLVEALEFYASGNHWAIYPIHGERILEKGAMARKALEQFKEDV